MDVVRCLLPVARWPLPFVFGPVAATRQGACGFGSEARARTKKSVRHGGRRFFLGTPRFVPHAFRTKARSPCLIATPCVVGVRRLVNCRVAPEGEADSRGVAHHGPARKGMSRTLQLGENGGLNRLTVSGKLPGYTLFLMEQTIYMGRGQMSFFVDETANLHCSVVRWTLRYTARRHRA